MSESIRFLSLQMEVTLNDNRTEMIIRVNGTKVDLETFQTGKQPPALVKSSAKSKLQTEY